MGNFLLREKKTEDILCFLSDPSNSDFVCLEEYFVHHSRPEISNQMPPESLNTFDIRYMCGAVFCRYCLKTHCITREQWTH